MPAEAPVRTKRPPARAEPRAGTCIPFASSRHLLETRAVTLAKERERERERERETLARALRIRRCGVCETCRKKHGLLSPLPAALFSSVISRVSGSRFGRRRVRTRSSRGVKLVAFQNTLRRPRLETRLRHTPKSQRAFSSASVLSHSRQTLLPLLRKVRIMTISLNCFQVSRARGTARPSRAALCQRHFVKKYKWAVFVRETRANVRSISLFKERVSAKESKSRGPFFPKGARSGLTW